MFDLVEVAPAVVVVSNSRLSGTDAFRLKMVTNKTNLSDPGVHHTIDGRVCHVHENVRAGALELRVKK